MYVAWAQMFAVHQMKVVDAWQQRHTCQDSGQSVQDSGQSVQTSEGEANKAESAMAVDVETSEADGASDDSQVSCHSSSPVFERPTTSRQPYSSRAPCRNKPSILLDPIIPEKGVHTCVRSAQFFLGASWLWNSFQLQLANTQTFHIQNQHFFKVFIYFSVQLQCIDRWVHPGCNEILGLLEQHFFTYLTVLYIYIYLCMYLLFSLYILHRHANYYLHTYIYIYMYISYLILNQGQTWSLSLDKSIS